MGATTFMQKAKGTSPGNAFTNAVTKAQYDHGHGGYTGTIAEKHDFIVIAVPDGEDPRGFAAQLIDSGDPRIDNKWGPAGCVQSRPGEWLFFGWASC